ncbi:toxin-antitoxin system YwqK family antitoxin [Streptomyces sp. NPDC056061]|uniref:toxin-antitoxin system YwqK family antitoxin n=1 Tax=Streptomyces sp. NPDC056061 TaxID=3345700 RepID=UPI0035DD8EF4
MVSAQRIDVDDPDVDMDGNQRFRYRGALLTGELAEYSDGCLISLDEYTDGVPDGLSREWYRDGTLRSEGVARAGRAVGEFREWHPNGALGCRKFFDGAPASLREEETWDEHGVLLTSWHRDDG